MHELNTKSSDSMSSAFILFTFCSVIAVTLFVVGGSISRMLYIPAVILVFLAYYALVHIFHQFRKRRIVAPPRIAVSSLETSPGDTLSLIYEQKFKARTNIKTLQMQLILRERATYTKGTDRYTVKYDHLMQDISLPPQVFRRGEHLQRNWEINIPVNAMHTFKAYNNKLLWLILVKLEFNRNMKSNYESEITVLPTSSVQL